MKVSHETYYISEPDGRRFDSKSELECIEHETNYKIAQKIMEPLKERPDSCSFTNGSLGYIQHNRATALSVRNKLLKFFQRYSEHGCLHQESINNDWSENASWVSRILGESVPRSIEEMTWSRFVCINSDGREYGQLFYANNPDKAECQEEYV